MASDAETLPRVCWTGRETQRDTAYSWDNRVCRPSGPLVIQRTLSGRCFIEDRTGRHIASAGQAMLFVYGEESRYGYPAEAEEPYVLSYMNIDPGLCLLPLFDLLRATSGPVVRLPPESAPARLYDELFDRYRACSFQDPWQESELLTRLLHELLREQGRVAHPEDGIARGHRLIHTRFRSALTLKELARECGISREHFLRAFRQRYGEAPGGVLRRLRLRHARDLLWSTDWTVRRIALESGFASGNSFCRAYRREFAHSPEQERSGR